MKQFETQVLIIGAGAAGVRAAIELEQHGVETLVLGKREHGDAHTTWARGGINASLGTLDPEDSWAIHAADTLDEGHYINDESMVETVARDMPYRIRELEEWGMDFSRTDDGRIAQRYFGAQSFRRTCFAGDHTGESLLDTLVDKAKELDTAYRENTYITELVTEDDRVVGAYGFDMDTGERLLFASEATVVAAGGYAGIYNRHSSRDDENNGDGVALTYDVGAEVMDTEFMQFHPTGMVGDRYGDEWDGRLVTEAVRGEGGRLYNAEGDRFMNEYSPDQMELDARDVVARAIWTEIQDGRGTENDGVYLDISHLDEVFIRERLPRMCERFQQLGVNIAEEPMEVAPTTHYSMGGVRIDPDTGYTGVDGLYVAGETTVGVHGANRLGGNSLAETVVYGKQIGSHLVTELSGEILSIEPPAGSRIERLDKTGEYEPSEMYDTLRSTLQEHVGVERSEESLETAKEVLSSLPDTPELLDVHSVSDLETASNYLYSLTVARLLVDGALRREESRGAHYRTDCPEKSDEWQTNIVYKRDSKPQHTSPTSPSETVQQALDENHELDYHHLE